MHHATHATNDSRRTLLVGLLLALGLGCQSTPDARKARASAEDREPGDAAPAAAVTDAPARAPDGAVPKPVLVELFTSQGCNSCPPADAFVGELAALDWSRDTVIALTFHVTYWDDLGWKDPYAQQLFDQRQIGYAQQVPGRRAAGETTMRGPYTPQMVVDGRVHFSGTLRDMARAEVTRLADQPTLIELAVTRALDEPGRTVTIEATSSTRDGAELDTDQAKIGVFAALAEDRVQTEVPRGENAGKQLIEFNVVRAFQGPRLFRSHRAQNTSSFELALPEGVPPARLHAVVFVQDLASLAVYTARAVPLVAAG